MHLYTSAGVRIFSAAREVAGGPLLPFPAASLTEGNSGSPVAPLTELTILTRQRCRYKHWGRFPNANTVCDAGGVSDDTTAVRWRNAVCQLQPARIHLGGLRGEDRRLDHGWSRRNQEWISTYLQYRTLHLGKRTVADALLWTIGEWPARRSGCRGCLSPLSATGGVSSNPCTRPLVAGPLDCIL